MSKEYASGEVFFSDLRVLIEAWCDRRCLHTLAILLPAFTSFNGMTDGWAELLVALKRLPSSKDALFEDERATLADLTQAADKAVHGR